MSARQSFYVPVFMTVVAALCWSRPAWAPPGGTPQCQKDLNTCNANLSTCNNGRATCNTNLATCNSNLSQSQGNLATCNSSLSTCNTSLSQSQDNLATCNSNLSQSQDNLATCEADLAACEANASAFPASGQTTSVRAGDDGDLEAGATLSYTDTGETILDNNTGLEWEKKSDDGSIHDKDTAYTWENAFAVHVAGLNTAPCFAEFCDWRLPNIKELQSIVNYGTFNPSVSSAFNNSCDSGDTVMDGSCTAALLYWSSTTFALGPGSAWGVGFDVGGVGGVIKGNARPVRAVRGGL